MEHKDIKFKKSAIMYIFIMVIIAIFIVGGFFLLKGYKKVLFDSNDKLYFKSFVQLFEPDEYEFHSLDAYYLSDTKMYYYNAKYTCYSSIDDTWYDVDEVTYGRVGKFYNSYCLSWDDLHGFEDINLEFQRALKEGIHNTYTEKEINDFLEKTHKEKSIE